MFQCKVNNRLCVPTIALVATFAFFSLTFRAAAADVRDNAHQFEPATLDQVNSIVKQIKEKHGKDLTISTFESIPDNQKVRFSASTKDDFYEHWLRQEARQSETNGVFILIVKDPGRLQIGVGNATRTKVFTDRDRDELREVMIARFREKQFDEGLIDGAKFVLDRMNKNSGMGDNASAAPATKPASDTPGTVPMPATQPSTAPTSAGTDATPKPESTEKPEAPKPASPAPDAKPAEGAAPDAAPKPESSPKPEAEKDQSSPKPDSDVKSSTPAAVESGK